MKKILSAILLLILSVSMILAQDSDLKSLALEEFQQEHYDKAINLLEKALEQSPEDAEIYYYLGFFNHYRAYDSRPIKGYDYSYSEKVFNYLDKAIELNPSYGNAKYFYGAECSANALIAMQNYDLEKLTYFYDLAYEKGAYPGWLLEFGRNLLASCDEDAILFTGGNADFDVCSYLQLIEGYRTDITIIPIGNIDRPWYVKFLKNGLKGGVRKISINLTESQIMDIHPYKWDTTTVMIPVSQELRQKYDLSEDYEMPWEVKPDLFSDRYQSKIAGEKAKIRTYLSPQRAILLQIVEDNFPYRPIFFSNLATPSFYGGLDLFFQYCGLVSALLPFETGDTEYRYNYEIIEHLFQNDNFDDFSMINEYDIPRISGIVFNYHQSLLVLADYYRRNSDLMRLEALTEFYKNKLAIGFNPVQETRYLEILDRMKK